MNRSFSPEFVSLEDLRERNLPILRAQGWPEDSYTDTIGGAACFMAFAHVDVSWFLGSDSFNEYVYEYGKLIPFTFFSWFPTSRQFLGIRGDKLIRTSTRHTKLSRRLWFDPGAHILPRPL